MTLSKRSKVDRLHLGNNYFNLGHASLRKLLFKGDDSAASTEGDPELLLRRRQGMYHVPPNAGTLRPIPQRENSVPSDPVQHLRLLNLVDKSKSKWSGTDSDDYRHKTRPFYSGYSSLKSSDELIDEDFESILFTVLSRYNAPDEIGAQTPEESDRHLKALFTDFRQNPDKPTTARYLAALCRAFDDSRQPHAHLSARIAALMSPRAVEYYKDLTGSDHRWSDIIRAADPDVPGAENFGQASCRRHLANTIPIIIKRFPENHAIASGEWYELLANRYTGCYCLDIHRPCHLDNFLNG